MTPEAQHQAVAELCGYYLIHDEATDSCALRHPTLTLRYGWHPRGHEQSAWEDAPDWLNDLNATRDAEGTFEHLDVYCYELIKVVSRGQETWQLHQLARATEAQRVEAILRTVGKWDDSK